MKFLITGASGFIGSNLCRLLDEHEVVKLPHSELLSPTTLQKRLETLQPDYIVHLSAYGNHSTQQDDQETLTNILGTWNLLQASLNVPYKALINFGSSSEYGQKATSMSERDLPETFTLYGATKVASTYLCRAISKKYNKPIVTVRPFSVYGEGEASHRFIPTVIRCLLTEQEILVLDPQAKHDWIYIKDFIDGLLQVIDNVNILSGQVVNIGTGMESTNTLIVKSLEYISKKKIKQTQLTPLRPQDSITWKADITKLGSFGWRPKTKLLIGLSQTYQYYANKYYAN